MYSLVIIGAGPAGISLAVEARAAGLPKEKILILEKAEAHSWVIRSLYPDKKLVTANYKGIKAVCHGVMTMPDMGKQDALNLLDNAIKNTGVEVHYNEEVLKIASFHENGKNRFEIETAKGNYEAENVAIAIGIFGRPKKPSYKLPKELRKVIHFDVTSFDTQNEKILVVGGGDTASENVQFLQEKGHQVSLSYRGNEFYRMNPINKQSILLLEEQKKVELLLETNIEKVTVSDDGKPVVHFKEIGERTYDRLVYSLGGTTPQNFLKVIGITFTEDSPDIDEYGETGIKGLFLCGDLSLGKRGGSIVSAFNASRRTIEALCIRYLHCVVPIDQRDLEPWMKVEK
ncbi:MAG TPA: hypothetical protein ENK85_05745 [Saprospiraceae bacterium]|nr:hypothetical protein [Saprospiraceae bacterium]